MRGAGDGAASVHGISGNVRNRAADALALNQREVDIGA
jgi:hypothetical protein